MKLEVTKRITRTETVNVELPYYYEHDLLLDWADSVIYGKIEEKRTTRIQITRHYQGGTREFELEIDPRPASEFSKYLTDDDYESTEAAYLAAKAEMLAALEKV